MAALSKMLFIPHSYNLEYFKQLSFHIHQAFKHIHLPII